MKTSAMFLAAFGICLGVTGAGSANVVTLQFNANDVFQYATTDDTTLNQQGTARKVWGAPSLPTGRTYRTYNNGVRDPGATAAQDLQSVANIVGWTGATGGYQGVSFVQLSLRGGVAVGTWGEKIRVKSGALIASVNGEYNWTAVVNPTGTPIYNTILGHENHQEAISSFKPADELWTVTGNLYVDDDGDGFYDTGEDLELGNQYTIWFNAVTNNWPCNDDYGNSTEAAPFPQIQGTILATGIPWWARPGNINLDGIVDVQDLAILAYNYNQTVGMDWTTGDLNFDSAVDVQDLAILAYNYNQPQTMPPPGAPVPEPMTLGLLTLGGLALIRRRRK